MKNLKIVFTSVLVLAICFLFIVYKLKKVKHYALSIVSSKQSKLDETVKKLSSVFFFNIHGKRVGKIGGKFIKKYAPGGIIIMSENVSDETGLKKLLSSIKSIYVNNNLTPPLVGIDQEGGRVRRIKNSHFNQASAKNSAKRGAAYIKDQAHAVFLRLKEIGFSINFAPVCDVLTNPRNKVIGDRSFGSDQRTVSNMIASYLRGSEGLGVARCAKHFPGHGNVSADSHKRLPVDQSSLDELKILPFKTAIKANIEMIMVGHLLFPKIENHPATFSKKIIGYLKNQLGFKGIVISDDLSMGALRKNYKLPEVIISSLKSGMDMFIYISPRYATTIKLLKNTAKLIIKDENALVALEQAYEKVKAFRLKYAR